MLRFVNKNLNRYTDIVRKIPRHQNTLSNRSTPNFAYFRIILLFSVRFHNHSILNHGLYKRSAITCCALNKNIQKKKNSNSRLHELEKVVAYWLKNSENISFSRSVISVPSVDSRNILMATILIGSLMLNSSPSTLCSNFPMKFRMCLLNIGKCE